MTANLSKRAWWRRCWPAVFLFVLFSVHGQPAAAQLAAAGTSLTVTTPNAVATFAGADLVGLTNRVTGESYLRNPSTGQLAAVTAFNSFEPLQPTDWTIGTDPTTGHLLATITAQAPGRSLTLTVRIDPLSQEIVLRPSAAAGSPGMRDASWSLAGLDLSAGRLIVPAHTGIVLDAANPGVGLYLQYPNMWHAQMAVYEAPLGSFVLYSTDQGVIPKRLQASTRGNTTIDVAIMTEVDGPFPSAVAVPAVEWRLKAFAGDWRVAAQTYREWLVTNRPPVSNAAHPWVNEIRTVVSPYMDINLLAPLAKTLVPSRTLLYLVDWRRDSYDFNYPDYTPRSDTAAFVNAAKALGFKVMLHVDLIGVSSYNPDYPAMQPYQARFPDTLQPMGWYWHLDPSTPGRFAFINPAASAFRSLFIARLRPAITALNPDALHLDISGAMFNDGNGPIEGRNYGLGSAKLHEELIAAFPSVALGGEGENDLLYRYHSFAQAWYGPVEPVGHPIATFLLSPHVQYYGHLGQPAAWETGFKEDLIQLHRRAVLPRFPFWSASNLDMSNTDNARLISILQSWQTHGFTPAWNNNWSGALVRYESPAGATAAFTDSGTVFSLTAAGTPLFQIAHDVSQVATTRFIPSWPAFDGTTLYGLDPAKTYFLDSLPRPSTTHVTSLPSGVRLGAGTMISPSFAHVELNAASSSFDFLRLLRARPGVTYQGADTGLASAAEVRPGEITAGGSRRTGIFIHPPWQGLIGGETFVEYAVPVPSAAVLHFSVGVADDASCSDGVTFRVTVGGVERWSRHVLRTGWQNGLVDLSAYAGTTVPLRIISHPGPAHHTGCDWSLWNGLVLTSVGNTTSITVPLSLAPGSSVAAFEGDGTLSVNPPSSPSVASVPVPGTFTLFTNAGTPATAGLNLAHVPFEVWSAAPGELPKLGSYNGTGTVGTATSGGVTRNSAIFAHPPTGRTVLTWVLRLPASDTFRLGWNAGISDAFVSFEGLEFLVRVNGVTYWRLATGAAGWTAGALDLSPWRNQTVLVEFVTDSVTNNWNDAAYWADLVMTAAGGTCAYGVSGTSTVHPAGGSFPFSIAAGQHCPWKAVSSAPWITLDSNSGIGSRSTAYTVAPNPGATRVGTISLGGQTFTVTQFSSTSFTDDPLRSGSSAIRAVHVAELRGRIDVLRDRHGLGSYPWTSPAPSPGLSVMRATDIVDLRRAITDVYGRLGRTAPVFSDATLMPGMTIRADHIQEIRAAILAVE